MKLKPYKSKAIPVKGYFVTEVSANGKVEKETKISVTFGPSGKNLLGRYTAFDLDVLKVNVYQVVTKPSNPLRETTVPANEDVKHLSYFEMRKYLTPLSKCDQILEECTSEI